ncbi:uncharacterized protein HGUI_00372 [Hanseniaspora guilliermondii]|uniref:RRM domain-containing protein n=1 Tax=Hanseniaspora guilliermondii TaxID=56406 RepID=A0A1L0AX73_9ASCO|nr:uncharacterized protein HGUI_00372 [Hanseniaspora guilliermondii]
MAKVSKNELKARKEQEEAITNEDIKNIENNSEISELSASDSGEEFDGFDEDEEDDNNSHKIKKLDTTINNNKKKESKKQKKILYVSRLPKGFDEAELAKYFSQFGDITACKIAKNKKTNKSRHYGFIKFDNDDDCDVASESMDNYLLMGHILKVKVIKGGNISKLRDYKKNIILREKLKWKNLDKITEDTVEKYEKQADDRHANRLNKLKESGIEFEY